MALACGEMGDLIGLRAISIIAVEVKGGEWVILGIAVSEYSQSSSAHP